MEIILIIVLLLILTLFAIWIIKNNENVKVSDYVIKSTKLPKEFNGYKIVQMSDIHNKDFKNDGNHIVELILESNPDIMVITGDLIDSRKTDMELALKFLDKLIPIAPIFYVTGNHESSINGYRKFEKQLINRGIHVLNDSTEILRRNDAKIILMGIEDPNFDRIHNRSLKVRDIAKNKLDKFELIDGFKILLVHRPDFFENYVENGIDLILAGHTHGGQINLPLLGGIIAPGQGLFPKYDSGLFKSENSTMIISRGLGDSSFPYRVNNNPEIIAIELRRT